MFLNEFMSPSSLKYNGNILIIICVWLNIILSLYFDRNDSYYNVGKYKRKWLLVFFFKFPWSIYMTCNRFKDMSCILGFRALQPNYVFLKHIFLLFLYSKGGIILSDNDFKFYNILFKCKRGRFSCFYDWIYDFWKFWNNDWTYYFFKLSSECKKSVANGFLYRA